MDPAVLGLSKVLVALHRSLGIVDVVQLFSSA